MDIAAIKDGFEKLYAEMAGMPLREMDDIIYTTCTLCREHEKPGFVAGIKVASEWRRRCDSKLSQVRREIQNATA